MNFTKKSYGYLLLILLLVFPLAACNSAQGGKESEQPKIAVLLWSREFEFMVALDEAMQKKGEELGVQVEVLDGQSDSQMQTRQIEDSIAKQVDAIILAPVNSDELVPGVKRANEAGIPVLTVDGVLSKGADIKGAIAFDNKEAGKMAAEFIQKTVGEGDILEVTGAPGTYHATLRGGGFKDEMKKTDAFKVISKNANWDAQNAQSITADAVTATPGIKAIFSHNDDMIRGINGGLSQIGKDKDVAVVGTDGTPLALERIRTDKQLATVDQDPYKMGAAAVQAAVDVINGKEIPKEQFIEPKMITKENVDDQELWGNKFDKK
ncbi:sugar ABC transporter substrate-binding protein [Peribacillus frigoritolerans]|uniref:sugar ABC transporter substrate-binding protein n=1 Tax=Peribacillus frigoritolerans TaxID=450367 RepID=UPI002417F967|nr:sugar ABC transporter substrate-binding protein [Peribacillus frigoritolerans]MDG4850345.1 sugar ABC transporter substrate-binding protein [Peribacillus frigoritolerans]